MVIVVFAEFGSLIFDKLYFFNFSLDSALGIDSSRGDSALKREKLGVFYGSVLATETFLSITSSTTGSSSLTLF